MNTFLIALALVIAGVLVWKLWKPFVMPPKRDLAPDQARLLFVYTNWCGHSKKAMPEWEKLESQLSSLTFGTTRVTPVAVDAEADQATATLYEVVAYPTVLLETREGIYPYPKRVTASGLREFLASKLGEERSSL